MEKFYDIILGKFYRGFSEKILHTISPPAESQKFMLKYVVLNLKKKFHTISSGSNSRHLGLRASVLPYEQTNSYNMEGDFRYIYFQFWVFGSAFLFTFRLLIENYFHSLY